MASTDEPDPLTPTERAAAAGELPAWSRVVPARRDHVARVAALMAEWARGLELDESEVARWAAAGWLHDALRDADPADLVAEVGPGERDLPPQVLHGPAAAARLHGKVDPRIELAVRHHTIGHPRLDELGRALYLADFLDPGRRFAEEWRAGLRDRMPADMPRVLVEVVAARIRHLLDAQRPVRPETIGFWNCAVKAVES